MPSLGRALGVPDDLHSPFHRDLASDATRAALLVLGGSVGGQLVQALGGSETHVAALRASSSVGLLLSIGYVALGRKRSALTMVFWAEALGLALVASLALIDPSRPAAGAPGVSPATALAVVVAAAIALSSLMSPFLSTVYALVYPPLWRARLISYGRMAGGSVAVACAWVAGRVLSGDPGAFRLLFPAVAAVGLVNAWRFFRMPVPQAQAPPLPATRSAWQVLRHDRMFRNFQIWQFLLGFAHLAAVPVIDLHVRRGLGLGIESAVLVVANGVVAQSVILLTVRYQGGLFDRLGLVRHRVLTSCLVGASLLVWAVADGLPLAVVAAVLEGLGIAGGQIIWMIGAHAFARKEDLPTYAGVHTFLTGIRGVIAPAVGVWLMSRTALAGHHGVFFSIAAALVFVSALGHHRSVRVPATNPAESGGTEGAVEAHRTLASKPRGR